MVMDQIPFTYRTQVKPYLDSDEEVWIRWFATQDGAQLFPEVTAFYSHFWDDKNIDFGVPDVGEDPTVFRQGIPIRRHPLPGTCYKGTAQQFQGFLTTDGPSPVPPCCVVDWANLSLSIKLADAESGSAIGTANGSSTATATGAYLFASQGNAAGTSSAAGTGLACVFSACCPGYCLPATLYLTVVGSDLGDGTYPLTYNAGFGGRWLYGGVLGSCPATSNHVILSCSSGTWELQIQKPLVGYYLDFPTLVSCNPLQFASFTAPPTCTGGTNPGTWTITA